MKGIGFQTIFNRTSGIVNPIPFFTIISALVICVSSGINESFSLDSRLLPPWYDEAKFGIFIHWGVFSVPSFGSEGFWEKWKGSKHPNYVEFMKKNYSPDFPYQDFAPMFKAEFFDPDQWVEILQSSGAKYVIVPSKHKDGFAMWPSNYSYNWNAMAVGPKRDLTGDLVNAIRAQTGLKLGLFYALFEWFNPFYINDKANNWTTQEFVKFKVTPELHDIVNKYKPDLIWSDSYGHWDAPSDYWQSKEFLAWLYNESPVKDHVVVNDRWGKDSQCIHGGYLTCEDRFNPGTLKTKKWENCFTIDRYSWGFRRNAILSDFYCPSELIKEMVETVSCGGNFLLNIAPSACGQISPIFEERLRQIGKWLEINGQAIFSSKTWIYQRDFLTDTVWYTCDGSMTDPLVYAIFLSWPETDKVRLGAPISGNVTQVSLLGYNGVLKWAASGPSGIVITLPSRFQMLNEWAWTIQLKNLRNQAFQ